jgi:hypothetical protein
MSDRVVEAFDVLSSVDPPISWDDVVARVAFDTDAVDLADEPSGRSPRRRITAALAAAAMVAVVVGVFVVATRDADSSRRPHVSTSGSSGPAATEPTPTTLPETRSQRTNAVTAWTGSQYLVWSGEAGDGEGSGRANGWAYVPEGNSATDIPTAPIAPRSGAVGVWTGEELIVCCGVGVDAANGDEYRTDTAAAYRPATRAWRRIADPPDDAARPFGAAAWTGRDMIVIFGARSDYGVGKAFAYDPAADRWRRLADPPASVIGRPQVAWTGESLVVWSPGSRPAGDSGFWYDPATDDWTPLPRVPQANATTLGSMVWTGDEIIVYGLSAIDETRAAGARLSLGDDAWTPLPDPGLRPIDWFEGTPGSQSLAWNGLGHRLVVWPVHGDEYGTAGPPLLSFDPDTGRWTQIVLSAGLGYEPDLTAGRGAVYRPDREHPVVAHIETG